MRAVAVVATIAAALVPAWGSAGASPPPPTPALAVMRADGTDQRVLVESLPAYEPATWSADGTRLTYWDYQGIHVVNVATGSNTVAGPGRHPAWSPTGEEIASVAPGEYGGPTSLEVAASDGSGRRVLTTRAWDGPLTWSPDGTRIAFLSCDRPGCIPGLSVVDADGTDERLLAADARTASWSPDGTALVVALRNNDLHVVDLASGTVTANLTPGEENFGHNPDWGALGRIAYTGQSPEGITVWLVDPDGTDAVVLHEGDHPSWSPDGSKVAFVDGDLRVHAPGTVGMPALAPGGERELFPSWSPDGRSIAYVSEDRPTNWTDYARSVSASATRRSVRARVEVTTQGSEACAHTVRIRLQRRTQGEWSTVDKARTDEDGRARWSSRGLRGTYRVQAPERYLGYPGDSSRCLAATSARFRLGDRAS